MVVKRWHIKKGEQDVISAECNSLVATLIPDYRDEIPQIGRVLEVEGASVTIEWLQGTYFSIWRICEKRKGRSLGRRHPKTAIISNVELRVKGFQDLSGTSLRGYILLCWILRMINIMIVTSYMGNKNYLQNSY